MFIAEAVDLAGNEGRLVMLGVGHVAHNLGAVTGVGPQVLDPAIGILGDNRVGRAQNGLGRAVVLLEKNGPRVRVVLFEFHDVTDRRTAEGIDRLVRVADHGQLSRRDYDAVTARLATARAVTASMSNQLTHELILRSVGVLVLIDQDVPETPVVVLGNLGEGLKDVDRRHDQVVEIHRIGLTQTGLVHPVGLGHHAFVMAGLAEPGRIGLLVNQFVLEV